MSAMGKTIPAVAVGTLMSVSAAAWADGPEWAWAARWGWLPGTALGLVGGLWGAVGGACAVRGKARGLVMAWGTGLVLLCAVVLVYAVILLAQGRPFWAWYPLLLPGCIGLFVVGPLLPVMRGRYAQAEMRRLEAQDIA